MKDYESKKAEFDAHWFDEDGSIVIHRNKEFEEASQTLSKYIEGLHLSSVQNNELVRLAIEMVNVAERGAFADGSFFAAGLAELSESA